MYLDNIIVSIDDDRYHEQSIKKLSDTITEYYSMVNGDYDDDDDVELIESESIESEPIGTEPIDIESNIQESIIDELMILDDSDTSITPVKGNKSDSDSDSNSDSDSDSDSSDSEIDSVFLSSKKVKTIVKDKYLDEFINQKVDNSNIKLYMRKPEYQYNLENFLITSQNY